MRQEIDRWARNDGTDGFEEEFLQKFDRQNQQTKWVDRFDRIYQGRKSIEEFNEEFLRARKRADPTEAIPVALLIRKYIKAIKSDIGNFIYQQMPNSLEAAMEAAE